MEISVRKVQSRRHPSYVLVDRDGNSKLRNDLRNHDKLKKTLKKMIE